MYTSSAAPSLSAVRQHKSGGAKQRKMVIKPFKNKPTLPANFMEVTWEKLHAAVVAVQRKQPSSISYEELYRAVEDLCIQKMSADVYKRLERVCDTHIRSVMELLVTKVQSNAATDNVLAVVEGQWVEFCSGLTTIRSIFLYLDRSYALQETSVMPLWDLGLSQFRTHLQNSPSVLRQLLDGIMAMVLDDRRHMAINKSLLRDLLRMLRDLRMYESHFLVRYIKESEAYFGNEGQEMMMKADISLFLLHVENRLAEAVSQTHAYLDNQSTLKPLLQCIEKYLLQPHVNNLIQRGFDSLLDLSKVSDLTRMYELLNRIHALKPLCEAWRVYIRAKGTDIIAVADPEMEKETVEKFLLFKKKLDGVLSSSFGSNEQFALILKDSCSEAINSRPNRPSELLAKYIDTKMRTKGPEQEAENILDRVMILFRFIQGKDTFEAFYRNHLAKRLLLGKSASVDLEKSMITKLKTECGSVFTAKLEVHFVLIISILSMNILLTHFIIIVHYFYFYCCSFAFIFIIIIIIIIIFRVCLKMSSSLAAQ
jgi:cullin-4